MSNCEKCGKQLSWMGQNASCSFAPYFIKQHPEYKGRKFCRECMVKEYAEMHFRGAQDRKTVFMQDTLINIIQDRQRRLTIYSDVATKFGYTFKQIEDASYNTGFWSPMPRQIHPTTMIFEKVEKTIITK